MRTRLYWCRQCEETHQRVGYARNCDPEPPQRSDYPSPYVISDNLPGGVNGLFHHAALKKIDSKSAYRRATKDAGCVEIGNEAAAAMKPRAYAETSDKVIQSGVNEALHRLGVSSESDMGKIEWTPPTTTLTA